LFKKSIYILDLGDNLSRYSHVRLSVHLSVHVNKEISEMVRPRNTKFGMKTSYNCTQIKFILNFGCHAPFAHNHITLVIIKLETWASAGMN